MKPVIAKSTMVISLSGSKTTATGLSTTRPQPYKVSVYMLKEAATGYVEVVGMEAKQSLDPKQLVEISV